MLAFEAKTQDVALPLRTKPTLRTDCVPYLLGYNALAFARLSNQAGIQPIQLQDVLAYVELSGIEKGYPAQKFLRLIQAMDAVHLNWWAERQNRKPIKSHKKSH